MPTDGILCVIPFFLGLLQLCSDLNGFPMGGARVVSKSGGLPFVVATPCILKVLCNIAERYSNHCLC